MSDYPIIQTEAKKQERCSKHLSNKCNLSCLVRGPASKKRCDKCVKKEMDKNHQSLPEMLFAEYLLDIFERRLLLRYK